MSGTDGAYGAPKVDVSDAPTLAAIQAWLKTGWVAQVCNTADGELWYIPKSGAAYKSTPAGVASVAGLSGVVSAAALAAALDANFLTPAEGNAAYDAIGAAAAAQSAAQAFSVQRSNHTGTQTASTISDFAAAVRATVLTGISFASTAIITATSTVLEAAGQLQAQVSFIVSTFAATVRAVVLTGLSLASSAAITATSTVLEALGQLQAQVTLRKVNILTTAGFTVPIVGNSVAIAVNDGTRIFNGSCLTISDGTRRIHCMVISGALSTTPTILCLEINTGASGQTMATAALVDHTSPSEYLSELDIRRFGAKLNGRIAIDGAITSGTSVVASATLAAYVQAQLNLGLTVLIGIVGAGTLGIPAVGTVVSVASNNITFTGFTASQTLVDTEVRVGTDDLAAWQAAHTYASNTGAIIRGPANPDSGFAGQTITILSNTWTITSSGILVQCCGRRRNQDAGIPSTFRGFCFSAMFVAANVGNKLIELLPPSGGAADPAMKTSAILDATLDGFMGNAGIVYSQTSVQQAQGRIFVTGARDVGADLTSLNNTQLEEAQDNTGDELDITIRVIDDPIRQTTPFTGWIPKCLVNGTVTAVPGGFTLTVDTVTGGLAFPASGAGVTLRIPVSITINGTPVRKYLDATYSAFGGTTFTSVQFTNPFGGSGTLQCIDNDHVTIRGAPSTAVGVRGDGSSTGNWSFSTLKLSGDHYDGAGLELRNCDSLRVPIVHMFRAGAGLAPGMDIWGGATTGASARSCAFGLISTPGGTVVRGTESFVAASDGHSFQAYSRENGEPAILLGTGVSNTEFAYLGGAKKSGLMGQYFESRLAANFVSAATITSQVITGWVVPGDAGEILKIRCYGLHQAASGAAGNRFTVNLPAGAVIDGWYFGGAATFASVSGARINSSTAIGANGAGAAVATGAAIVVNFTIELTVVMGTTAGNISVMVNPIGAVAATVFANSVLTASRIRA